MANPYPDMAEGGNQLADVPSIFAPSVSDHVPPVDLLVMGDHAYHQRPPTLSGSQNSLSQSSDEGPSSSRLSSHVSRSDNTPTSVVADKDSFVRDVAAFFSNEQLSDVVVTVGGHDFFSHKFVLAKSSDVFRTMLYGSIWVSNLSTSDSSPNSSVQRIKLQESPDCELVFSKFLQFLYTAEIELSVDGVVGILRLADKYNVASLRQLCVNFMVTHSRSPKLRNAISWYPWAKLLNIEQLLSQCRQTMSWHAEQLMRQDADDEWTSHDIELVRDILSSDEVIVRDEYSIFNAVSRWLLDPCRIGRLSENAIVLLPLVRFSQMFVTDLYRCERSELYVNEASHNVMHRLISAAYRFRELYPKSAELGIQGEFTSPFFYPRDYLTLIVDMVQMHNTLRFGIQVDVKMYSGAVPQERKEADWKIRYSKHTNVWQVTFMCHDSALVFDGEAHMQATVMIHDKNDNVIQVERLPSLAHGTVTTQSSPDTRMSDEATVASSSEPSQTAAMPRSFMTCTRGRVVSMSINVQVPENSQTMVVIIKPIP